MTDKRTDIAIGLAETLAGLRAELSRSQKLAKDSNIQFEIQNIDLELKVHVERAEKFEGNLGVKFWVVEAGAGGEQTDTNNRTQTIKLSMKAKDRINTDAEGNPKDASVSAVGDELK